VNLHSAGRRGESGLHSLCGPVGLRLRKMAREQCRREMGRELIADQRIAFDAQAEIAAQFPYGIPPMPGCETTEIESEAIDTPARSAQAIQGGDIHEQRRIVRR
jgi:hypothetical protein